MKDICGQLNINGLDVRYYLYISNFEKFYIENNLFNFIIELFFVNHDCYNYGVKISKIYLDSENFTYIFPIHDMKHFQIFLSLIGYNEDISSYIFPDRTVHHNWVNINTSKVTIIQELFDDLIKQNYKELISNLIEYQIKETAETFKLHIKSNIDVHSIYDKYSEISNNLIIKRIL